MAWDRFFNGPSKNYKDDRGRTNLIPSAVVGTVKHNIDPKKSGQIKVYLHRLDAGDQNNPDNWTTVDYLSPFFGTTPNTGSPDNEFGTFKDNPQSYGFWFTPPDLGIQVVCLFENGVSDFGWYIGSIPRTGLMHMVPAIGSSDSIVSNEAEAKNYGGATLLPVGEINDIRPSNRYGTQLTSQPRPVHSYMAASLNNQGLIRDPDRGTISSSSSRESPSKVFGISTPGRAIYQGGYSDSTILDAVKDATIPEDNYKVVGRRAGHTLVMDDGDLQGKDQLMRFRTAAGHMIMMNDTIGTLFIVHASGKSYIEMGKEGTIDMYSTNSVNIRTQGDLNLHADNNININAKNDLNISATNIKIESFQDTSQFTGGTLQQHTKGDHTLKVDSKMSFESSGDSMIKSGGTNYIKGGPNVKLNTGESSLSPQEVKPIPQVAHTDTLFDKEKGYLAAPAKLPSIVSRAPAHSPWAGANQGVNVKIDLTADANLPKAASPAVTATNVAANENSTSPVASSAVQSTVPNNVTEENKALVSQIAVNSQTADQKVGLSVDQVAAIKEADGAKVPAVGPLGLNPHQLEAAGYIKPGTADAVVAATTSGKTIEQAMPPNIFTGKDGINSMKDLVNNTSAQVTVANNLLTKSKTALTTAGVITGKEDPSQVSGLVLAGATHGTQATADFVKSTAAGTNTSIPSKIGAAIVAGGVAIASKIASKLGIKIPPNISEKLSGSIKDIVGSGNKAAEIQEKATGPLSGAKILDNLKGAVSSAFDKIKKGFKSLTAGKPQNLTTINAKNDEEKAAVDAGETAALDAGAQAPQSTAVKAPTLKESLSKVGSKIKAFFTPNPSGTANLTAGSATASNLVEVNHEGQSMIVDNNMPTKENPYAGLSDEQRKSFGNADPTDPYIRSRLGVPPLVSTTATASSGTSGASLPGTAGISGVLGSIKSSISAGADKVKGAIASLKTKLTGANKLTDVANKNLGPAESAKLSASLNSMKTGGSSIVLPTVAVGTTNTAVQSAQFGALLGDLKMPPGNLGDGIPTGSFSVPTASQSANYDKLKKELTELDTNKKWDLQTKYFNSKKKNGEEAAETTAAKEEWQTCLKRIEQIRGEIYANQTGSAPPAQIT